MCKLLFATTNQGKLREVRHYLGSPKLEIVGLSEAQKMFGLSAPPEVEESGDSYLTNARLKCEALFSWSGGMPTLADDSGLEVDALGGLPGLNTARYAGGNCTSDQNIEKLLSALSGQTKRTARFVCVLCLMTAPGESVSSRGELTGSIANEIKRGDGGFGYDPIFIPDGFAESLSQLKQDGNSVKTHRIKALENLKHAEILGLAEKLEKI